MANAIGCFNPEHDACAIRWNRRPNDWGFPAINTALAILYRDDAAEGAGDLAPYLYEVYDGDNLIGVLVAGNFNPENDSEIRSVWGDIVNRDNIAPELDGPFARFITEI